MKKLNPFLVGSFLEFFNENVLVSLDKFSEMIKG